MTEPHKITPENAERLRTWLKERGGIMIWNCHDLSRAGQTWTTPACGPEGEPVGKPHWAAGEVVRTIKDAAEVVVDVPKEVRRCRIAIRRGSQGLSFKLTDASSRKVRAAVAKAGESAWYEFDYETQEAVIFVADKTVPLMEWKA